MRDQRIDILRALGLLMIVLAHTAPPGILFQARNFDVPLMVLVSGLSFGVSHRNEPYADYVWKRVKRLVFPVWLFLTAYFLVMYATSYPMHLPDSKTIATSYLFLSGIGYVWVIRVFLLVALEAPFIFKLHRRIGQHGHYFMALALIYLLYEAAIPLGGAIGHPPLARAVQDIFFYAVPYGVVFAIGLRLPMLSQRAVLGLMATMLLVFLIGMVWLWRAHGMVVPTQEFKYPPRIYYLSYGLFVASLAWLCAARILKWVDGTVPGRFLDFLSQNSIWVYLWHIPFIEIIRLEYHLKFPLVVAAAVAITSIQVAFVNRVLVKNIDSLKLRGNVRTLLTG